MGEVEITLAVGFRLWIHRYEYVCCSRKQNLGTPPMTAHPLFSLQGKVVLLTGGAGLYGRGLAAFLAEAGATLVLASRDRGALEKVAADERKRGYAVEAE